MGLYARAAVFGAAAAVMFTLLSLSSKDAAGNLLTSVAVVLGLVVVAVACVQQAKLRRGTTGTLGSPSMEADEPRTRDTKGPACPTRP